MSTVVEEHILVVPASVLQSLGSFEGFRTDDGTYIDGLLSHPELSFQPRGPMERDPSFKQLIPYVLLECSWDGKPHLFCYTRGKGQGESRLHAKRSVGIGGHISREDADASDPYRTGMLRELEEEVIVESPWSEERVGLIYDPSTEVGQVHVGIVHRMRLESPRVRAREKDLMDAGFVPIEALPAELDRMETWSRLCLEALYQVS